MEYALNEAKTQAKKMLKAIKGETILSIKTNKLLASIGVKSNQEIKLKHCQFLVSKQLGFDNWHHAQEMLSGRLPLTKQVNMGAIFYNHACDAMMNLWFADYQQAKEVLAKKPESSWLLPYKKQFVVVNQHYLSLLKLDNENIQLSHHLQHDFYQGYNTDIWDKLAMQVIRNRTIKY